MTLYPYAGSGPDKYWKYKNNDPSIAHYSKIVAEKVVYKIRETIDEQARDIYRVRPEAIIAQDLYHAVVRILAQELTEHVKEIEQYEKENSGKIENFLMEDRRD